MKENLWKCLIISSLVLVKNTVFVGGLNLTHACSPCILNGNNFCVGEYPNFQIISGPAKNLFPSSIQGEQAWMKNSHPISWTTC